MRATDVIEAYIDDTVRLLPRRQREDVARELRSLLNEELHARAQESGRPPDEASAVSLVRGHGSPNEAAARYQAPWAIIDPADSTSWLRAGFIGAAALIVLSALSKRQPEVAKAEDDKVATWILAWFGFLVVAFGLRGWMRRRWPKSALWKPQDRNRANRVGAALVLPVAGLCVLLYAAPAWVLDRVSGGRMQTAWAAYTDDFEHFGLPLTIGLMVGLLALLSFAAIQGRWSRITRRIDIGLNCALAGLMLYLAVDGNIFQSAVVDQIARNVLAVVAAIYVPCVGVMIYGELGRVERAVATPEAS
jgi:hypothetical protein